MLAVLKFTLPGAVLFFTASTLASCSDSTPDRHLAASPKHTYDLCVRGISRTNSGVLRFCDQINDASVEALKRAVRPTDTQMILTSGGGTTSPAIEMGTLVREMGLEIKVRQFCLSACATYILPATESIVIEPYAIVAFHHTASFVADAIADKAGVADDHPSRNLASIERRYFQGLGIESNILDQIATSVEPYCIGYTRQGGQRMAVIRFRHEWTVPTPEQLRRLVRGKISGYWPSSGREVQDILSRTLGKESVVVRYGWSPLMDNQSSAKATPLPTCTA